MGWGEVGLAGVGWNGKEYDEVRSGMSEVVLPCPALPCPALLLPSIPQRHFQCPGVLSRGGHDGGHAFHTGSPAGDGRAGLAPVLAAAAGLHSQRLPLRLDMLLTSKLWQLAVPGLHLEDTVDSEANVGTAVHANTR